MKNLTHANIAGGGANSSLNSLSAKSLNNSKRFFTPIVASSLALFLSAGIANAAAKDCSSVAGASSDPKICYEYRQNDRNPTGNLTAVTNLTDLTWEDNGGILTPKAGGASLNYLEFQFNAGGGQAPAGATAGAGGYRITSGGIGLTQVIVLDAGTKSIEMANQAGGIGGKLSVIFGEGADSTRQFHLNLSKATGDFSFKGNIVIQAGKGWAGGGAGASKFVGDFGRKVVGDITISNRSGGNQSGHRTELTFTNDAGLEGNLTTKAGTTTATFANGNITGNVVVDDALGGFTLAKNIITFNGQDNKIQGKVVAEGGAMNNSMGVNQITFENGGSIDGEVQAGRGQNTITIKGTTGTIKGNVLSSNSGKNTITMESTTSTLEGNVQAHAAGSSSVTSTNEITFKNAGATIKGSVSVAGNNYANAKGVNTITFQNGGTIEGEVKATSGENKITFNGTGDATLNQRVWGDFDAIQQHRGKNTITMESSGTNTIKGGVHEQTANNIITMGGATATIEGGVKAIGNGYQNVDGKGNTTFGNTIKMKGTTSAIKGGISADEGFNTIEFGETGTPITSATI